MAEPVLDNCGNCRYWDTADENLDDDQRRDGDGVCRIQTYPDEFDNEVAYISTTDDESDFAILVTAEEFFCNLYKVRK